MPLTEDDLKALREVAEKARKYAEACRCSDDCPVCEASGFNKKFNHTLCLSLLDEIEELRKQVHFYRDVS